MKSPIHRKTGCSKSQRPTEEERRLKRAMQLFEEKQVEVLKVADSIARGANVGYTEADELYNAMIIMLCRKVHLLRAMEQMTLQARLAYARDCMMSLMLTAKSHGVIKASAMAKWELNKLESIAAKHGRSPLGMFRLFRDRYLDIVSDDEMEMVELILFHRLSHKEVAERMGKKPATIRKAMSRLYAKLRDHIVPDRGRS